MIGFAVALSGLAGPVYAQQDPLFRDPTMFFSAYPFDLAVADITGLTPGSLPDGWNDVVVVNSSFGSGPLVKSITVYRNTQNWAPNPLNGLVVAQTIPLTGWSQQWPYAVELADMDNDLDLDIVVSLQADAFGSPHSILFIPNVGGGNFNLAGAINTTLTDLTLIQIYGTCVADFDLDGLRDVAVAAGYSEKCHPEDVDTVSKVRVFVCWGMGGGSFLVDNFDFADLCGDGFERTGTDVSPGRLDSVNNNPDIAVAIYTPGVAGAGPEHVGTMPYFATRDFDRFWDPGLNSYGIQTGRLRGLTFEDAAQGRFESQPNSVSAALFCDFNGHLLRQPLAAFAADLPRGVSLGTIDNGTTIDAAFACQKGGPYGGHGCVVFQLTNALGVLGPPRFVRVSNVASMPEPRYVKITEMDGVCRRDLVATCWKLQQLSVVRARCPGDPPGGGGELTENGEFIEENGDKECFSDEEYEAYMKEGEEVDPNDGPGWDDSVGPFDW